MKNLISKVFINLILICGATATMAQNASDALRLSEPSILSGARSLSMGNAYTSLSNDLSASIFNPAGFGLNKKMEMDVSFNSNTFKNNTTLFNSAVTSSTDQTNFGQFGLVLPMPTVQGSLVFALGFSQLKEFNRTVQFNGYNSNNNSYIQDLLNYGSNNDLDLIYSLGLTYLDANKVDQTNINGKLNQSGSITQTGKINNWFLSGSMEVEQNIFVGATLDILSGTYKKNFNYWEEDLLGNYTSIQLDPTDTRTKGFKSFNINTLTDWDISGWDAKIGILAKVEDGFNFGATIQFPKTYTVKEGYSVQAKSVFTSKTFSESPTYDPVQYDITTPYEFTVGASYSQNNVTVSADAKLIDYSTMEFTDGFTQQARFDENNYIKNNFRAVINLHSGVEVVIPRTHFAIRGGFMVMPSAYKDDPSEFDKKFATAGVGYQSTKNISINFAYAYGWWKDIGDNYGSNLSRTYQDIKSQTVVLTMKYTF
jgi:hypothetical protein